MTSHVLQATAWYAPHHVGGTEVYVEGLVDALADRGIPSTVLTPRAAGGASRYINRGHDVETYPVGSAQPAEMRTGAPHLGFDEFQRLLAANTGAIYHQHSWTRGCGLAHLKAARVIGLKTVLTIHVAAVTCLRGTMLRFGVEPCSGRVASEPCAACWAHERGLPKPVATTLARLPLSASRGFWQLPSRVATALAARAIADERSEQIRQMIAAADRIVAVCRWLADALIANGVPRDRLIVSRQGLQPDFVTAAAVSVSSDRAKPLSLLYLGRWDPMKGIDVLVRAVRMTRADLRLTLRAVAQTDQDRAYATRVRGIAAGDSRIIFADPLPRNEVAAELGRHDVLAVPSLTMETGPLVVMEAQAAGLFVLGSWLGGIAELVSDGEHGELVTAGDVPAWAQAITRLAGRNVRRGQSAASRTMSDVAAEMANLYGSL